MIINEWQLNGRLNLALQHQYWADFALHLAMLSPDVREQAAFCFEETSSTTTQPTLAQQLGCRLERDPACQVQDLDLLAAQQQAFMQGGLASLRLQTLLQPVPTVIRHDAQKISADVAENLELHTIRHLQQAMSAKQTPDPTLLFDVLEQLNPPADSELAA